MQLQAGVSIVSLMISIVISMLGFAATFSLFTNLMVISSQQQQKQLLVNNVSTLITKIEFDINHAGFGLDHQQTEAHLLITEDNQSTLIQWRYFDSSKNKVICEGLEDLKIKIGDLWWRQLHSIAVNNNCNESDALSSFTWDYNGNEITRSQQTLSVMREVTVSEKNCSPFNKDTTQQQLRVSIVNEQGEAEQQFERIVSVCLINMLPSS